MSLVCLIEHRYGLRGLPAPVSLTGGYTNDPLRMGDVVVRFAPERVTEAELEYEHSLVARLAERVPEVCGPLRDRDGQTWFSHEGRVCSVWPWIPGRRGVRRSRTTRLTAAAVLARIHRAGLELEDLPSRPGQPSLGDLDLRTNWMWSLDDACAVRPDARLEELWMELCDIVAGGREADLVSGVVHSDFYPGNVIAQRGRVVGVIDWDYARPDWLMWELARSMWEFSKDKRLHDLRGDRATEFLRAYREAGGPVPHAEFHLLVPFIRVVRLAEALRHLTNAAHGRPWDIRYTAHNLRSLDNLGRRSVELTHTLT